MEGVIIIKHVPIQVASLIKDAGDVILSNTNKPILISILYYSDLIN